MVKCATPHCRKRRGKKKKFCHACHLRLVRERNPMWAQWRRLKDSARRRRINFCLPLWYFEMFARQTEYLTRVGKTGGSLTVDRKNNLLGYVVGNIQPMTLAENSVKQAKWDQRRMEAGYAWSCTKSTVQSH